MDDETNGKPYEQMDDLGGFPIIFGNTNITYLAILLFRDLFGMVSEFT